ncbi:predicted protein [Botrytis cinerea T4]|uniref:Uncharacterized protein n=1 Tax=Botryotinia fuckeliana (strain T4) TaxID=999810 RepID=G2YY06_BOTF4|nr:predicted protein [Botrytis cinerea T4]
MTETESHGNSRKAPLLLASQAPFTHSSSATPQTTI